MKKLILAVLLSGLFTGSAFAEKVTYEKAVESTRAYQEAMNKIDIGTATKGFSKAEIESSVSLSPPIVFNGRSNTACTNVYPPKGTKVSTHKINIVGTYQDQNDHARNHSYGVAQELTTNGATRICAGFLGASSYDFRYQITAHKK